MLEKRLRRFRTSIRPDHDEPPVRVTILCASAAVQRLWASPPLFEGGFFVWFSRRRETCGRAVNGDTVWLSCSIYLSSHSRQFRTPRPTLGKIVGIKFRIHNLYDFLRIFHACFCG